MTNENIRLGRRAFLAASTILGAAAMTSCSSAGSSGASASGPFASIDEWIAREAIPFSLDGDFDAAVDHMMAQLGDQVSVLGVGEPLHSGDEFLIVRNRIFQRLVAAHGFRAITIETNDVRARRVDAFIQGRGATSYDEIKDDGFTMGIGLWDHNRELVEWMRNYNDDPANAVKLNYYGTLASDQETTKSPRQTLELALAYLQSVDAAAAARRREVVEPLLGADAEWEGPASAIAQEIAVRVMTGDRTEVPAGAEIGVSPRAQALRLALEDLAFELQMRRAEFVAQTDNDSYGQALRNVAVARNLLAMHAALARRESLDTLVSMRDAMAAEHLAYIAEREQPRGKMLVFLHNTHLRRTKASLPWYDFWPTGAHLDQMFGARFAVVGGAVGQSEANFISAAEPESIEGRLLARGTDCFLPTWRGRRFPEGALAAVPERSGSGRPYVPYTQLFPQAVADFDMIAFVRQVSFTRGAPPHPG
jgi:erythromycin esterase-like protein